MGRESSQSWQCPDFESLFTVTPPLLLLLEKVRNLKCGKFKTGILALPTELNNWITKNIKCFDSLDMLNVFLSKVFS